MSYLEDDQDQNLQDDGSGQADNSDKGGSQPATADNQTSGSDNSASAKLPFHKDPEVQRYLDRQIKRKEREYEDKFKSLEQRLAERQPAQGNSTQAGLSEEEAQAVDLLIEKISRSPKALEKLGLTKINSLEERMNKSSESATEQLMESEFASVLDQYSKQYGYEKDELEEKLLEFMESDPWFRNKDYHKGGMSKVAKLYFSDKGKELAERETNLKLINDKKTKQTNGTEMPAKGSSASKGNNKLTGKAFLEDLVKRNGGEIAF